MDTEMYCYTPAGDRKVLPAEKVFDDWLDPATSAIACIDMHRGHVGDDPDEPRSRPPARRPRIPAHNLFHAARARSASP